MERSVSISQDSQAKIIYIRHNQDLLPEPVQADFFSPSYWQKKGCLVSRASGRGNAYAVVYNTAHFFLRHYQRGGVFGPLLHDYYLWTGLHATRAWREFKLLADMANSGLPVPRPVAAHVKRKGILYQADIVTERINGSATLTQLLAHGQLADTMWKAIGSCIRRFHDQGVFHADLNAHNILIDEKHTIWLIDFDRSFKARLGNRGKQANLRRLKRSLHKVWPDEVKTRLPITHAWDLLYKGYAELGFQ
ncbi:MAG: 3-deoxy-D-manno-octulosonic acid kinase [Desulfovermiculus sp.]